jgi:hypothetical protein
MHPTYAIKITPPTVASKSNGSVPRIYEMRYRAAWEIRFKK